MVIIHAMKQALEAFDAPILADEFEQRMRLRKACDALRQALKEIGANEPVGWITEDYETDKSATTYSSDTAWRWFIKGWPVKPLYTALPKREWVGLTDEQLDDVYFCVEGGSSEIETWREQARAIEAKLKERNT